MTKGLIQKIFEEFDIKQLSRNGQLDYMTRKNLFELEKELITAIKTKQFRITYKYPDKVVKLRHLIGDNND